MLNRCSDVCFTLFSEATSGVYVLFGLNLVFIVDFVILRVCKKGRIPLKREAVVGLSFFAIAVILLTLISRRWYFHCWDEYMHWDPFVRQIYKTDGFYVSGGWFKNVNYVQGLPLLAVYFVRLGGYTDGALILSNNILLLASFLVFLRAWETRGQILFNLLRIAFCYSVINTFSVLLLNSFIADILVGAVAAAILYRLHLDCSEKSLVQFLPVFLAYTFVKDICGYFSAAILFVIGVWEFLEIKRTSKRSFSLILRKYSAALISVIVWYSSWVIRLRLLGIQGDMKILINPEELWIAFFTRNNPFYNSVMDNFIRHLTQVRFVKSLSMTILLVIFLLLILLAKAIFPRQIRKKELWFLLSTIIIGLGYFFLLVATFLGTQKPGQAVIEEPEGFYLRFFSSFCILFMLVFVNFVFEAVWVNRGFLNAWQVIFFIFTGIFININLLNEYRIQIFMNSPDHRWIRAKEIHKKFENRFPVDSTALIINFEYTELEWLMINDLFVGERVAFLKDRTDYSAENTSKEDFIKLIDENKIDYLFLYKTSQEFWLGYQELFEESDYTFDLNPMIYRYDAGLKKFTLYAY